MKPPEQMTRAELVAEVEYLRFIIHGDIRDDAIDALRRKFRLTPHESRVVLCLYAAAGRPVCKSFIDEQLPLQPGRYERSTSTNNVAVHVSRIRSKIGRDAIETPGASHLYLGYRITDAGRQTVAAALA